MGDAHGTHRARRGAGGESPAAVAGGKATTMFDALEVMLRVLELLVPIEAKVRRHNAELAKQMARAADSVALNLGEGRWRKDGDRRRHYEMAAGSASELTVALRIA